MKKPQDYKKKSVKEKQDDFIKMLTQLREEKDMDAIADLFWKVITAYGLKADELAALNYYMMKRSLEAPVNATFKKRTYEPRCYTARSRWDLTSAKSLGECIR